MDIKKAFTDCVVVTPEGAEVSEEIIAAETPIVLSFNGLFHSKFTCTPTELEDLAAGLANSYGLAQTPEDIKEIQIIPHEEKDVVHLNVELNKTLAEDSFFQGKKNIQIEEEGFYREIVPFYGKLPLTPPIKAELIRKGGEILVNSQPWFKETGATHGCAFFNAQGETVVLREDISRSNALEKTLGYLFRNKIDVSCGFIFLSSRLAGALALRVAKAGIATVACVSAPGTLALKAGKEHHMGIAGFVRGDKFTVYTAPDRFELD